MVLVTKKPPALFHWTNSYGKIVIFSDGVTNTKSQKNVSSQGVLGKSADGSFGPHKLRYPSFYTPKILYPVNSHALMAAFVDANGVVVGRPFAIGKGVRISIPEGAAALSFGFNDISYAENSGYLEVTIEMPDDN